MLKAITLIIEKKLRLKLVLILFLSMLVQLLDVLSISTIIPIISSTVSSDTSQYFLKFFIFIFDYLPFINSENLFTSSIIFLIILFGVKSLIFVYFMWIQSRFVQDIRLNISKKLLQKYLDKNWLFFLKNNSSYLLRNIFNEVPTASNVVNILLNFATEIFLIIGFSSFLILIATEVSIAFMAFLAIISILIYLVVRGPLFKLGEKKINITGKILKYLSQSLEGAKDVKILGKEKYFVNTFDKANIRSSRIVVILAVLNSLPKPIIEFFSVIGIALCIYYLLGNNYSSGDVLIILASFLGAGFRVMPSLIRITVLFQKLRNMYPSISIISNELSISHDLKTKSNKKINFNNYIELKNVSFKYEENNKNIINDLNIQIPFGKKIGILGKSGAGKSTLVDLIVGLVKPTKGTVLSDGINIHEGIHDWQKKIGYVSQNVYLLDDTFYNNIAIGEEDSQASREKINNILKTLNLNEFIDTHPEGLDRFVGEKGSRISGGQKQRIGIARSLFRGPKILILDEATNSLDIHTEENIMNDLLGISNDMTCIIISHRISTLQNCDEIYILEKGNISKKGSYIEMKSHFENIK